MKTPNCLSTKDQQRPERDFQSRKGYQGLCNFRANGIENIFLDLSPQAVFYQTNVCKQPIADLKRHIPIINICWQGWRCDGAIQARSLLNLLRVAGHNPLRSEFMVGFAVTEEEVRDLTAFLESLTDRHLLTDKRFSDPWSSNP